MYNGLSLENRGIEVVEFICSQVGGADARADRWIAKDRDGHDYTHNEAEIEAMHF